MLEVKPNKAYKKHFIPYMIVTAFAVFLEIMVAVALIMLIADKDYKSAAFIVFCMISTAGGIFPFALKSCHIMFDKYTFYDDGFFVKLFYGKKVKYSIDQILKCEYYPNYRLYSNRAGSIHSDAIFFTTKNKIKHKFSLYRDFIDNYENLRMWVLDNLNVEMHENPPVELPLKYQQFMNGKSINNYKKGKRD